MYYLLNTNFNLRHMNKIQDFDEEFYRSTFFYKFPYLKYFSHFIEFRIIVCGLDSVVARRWINSMLVRQS